MNLTKSVKIAKKDKKGCQLSLTIDVKSDLVNKAFEDGFKKVQEQAQVEGFRKGKAPADMVRKNFAANIKQEALDIVIKEAMGIALTENKIKAVSMPSLTKADFTGFDKDKNFSFEMNVDIAPEFDVKGYKGIKVIKKSEVVSDADFENKMKEILEYNSRLEPDSADATVQADSFVTVKYIGEKDGKKDDKYSSDNELIDMSSPQGIAGMTEAIKSAKKGDTKEFESKIDEKTTIKFKVEVLELKKKVLPELNDEFVKTMNFDSVEKFKNHVREMMGKEAKQQSEQGVIKQIEEVLGKENTFELPASLVDYHTNMNVENFIKQFAGQMGQAGQGQKLPEITDEQKKGMAERVRPNVERDLRIGYVIHAIADKEKIQASDEDVKKELEKALERNGKTEEDKKKITEFFDKQKHQILASLNERKVFEFLKNSAKITEEKKA